MFVTISHFHPSLIFVARLEFSEAKLTISGLRGKLKSFLGGRINYSLHYRPQMSGGRTGDRGLKSSKLVSVLVATSNVHPSKIFVARLEFTQSLSFQLHGSLDNLCVKIWCGLNYSCKKLYTTGPRSQGRNRGGAEI